MSILITAPIDIEAGYGRKAREIAKPIAKKYWEETQIAFLNWGGNPKSDLMGTEYEFLLEKNKKISFDGMLDLHIHVGIPTEFKCHGNTNILFTSGAEVDRISHQWIKKINEDIDVVVVPSSFIANIFGNTSYEDKSGNTLKIEKPIIVVPESYSPSLFEDMGNGEEKEINEILSKIKEPQIFLTYGQMMEQKQIGEERKNISTLIVEFLKEFRGDNGVALVLKSSAITFSNYSYYRIEQYIKRIVNETIKEDPDSYPSVYLIEGFLSDPQLFSLMNNDRVVFHVTATHGEGFGRFLLEASLTGKPIIIPKIGSYRDFLWGESVEYMHVEWEEIPRSARMGDILIPDSKWVNMRDGEIKSAMRKVYKKHKNMSGAKLAKKNKVQYNSENISTKILDVVDKYYTREVNIIMPDIPDD